MFTAASATRTHELVASAKLPDDLQFQEMTEILDAILVLIAYAEDQPLGAPAQDWDVEATALKLQYGSDFLAIIAVGASVAAVIASLAKSVDLLSSAALKNEQRRKTKEERIALRMKRAEDEAAIVEERRRAAEVEKQAGRDSPAGREVRDRLNAAEDSHIHYLVDEYILRGISDHFDQRLEDYLSGAVETDPILDPASERRLALALSLIGEYGIEIRIRER